MKWEKIRKKTINGDGRLGFVLSLIILVYVYFELRELGKDEILELVTDPIFYMILVCLVLSVLIIMFILDKIFPAQ